MDKHIAVMAVLITAWAVTAMDYPTITYFSASQEEINNSEQVLSSINKSYFKGVDEIRYYSMRFGEWFNWRGLFIPYSNIIMMHTDGGIHHGTLLHELKHNWCWNNKQEINLNHQGCFLDTPIDKEYGQIK